MTLGLAARFMRRSAQTHFRHRPEAATWCRSWISAVSWRACCRRRRKGAITADITPLDQMGIDDTTMLRLLRPSSWNFAVNGQSPRGSGDDPRFERLRSSRASRAPDRARAGCEAYRAVIDRQIQQNWNAKSARLGGNPRSVLVPQQVIGRPERFKGNNVPRLKTTPCAISSPASAPTAISMAFADVVPALSAGGSTAASPAASRGNTAGWPESDQVALPSRSAGGINVLAVTLQSGKRAWQRVTGLSSRPCERPTRTRWGQDRSRSDQLG